MQRKKKDKKKSGTEIPQNGTKKKQRISSYDYDAWSRFNVDEACQDVDNKEEDSQDSSEDEDEDVENIEAAESEHCKLKANLEKEKGNNLFKDGKMEAAIEHYTKGIYLDPENPILPANRAMALIKLERYAAAETDCTSSLTLDPTYVKALARRAVARQHLKNYQGALQDYHEILKTEPKHKQAMTEIEKLTKLIKSMPKTAENQSQVRRRRSTKPYRCIPIREVGGEKSKESQVISKPGTKDGVKADVSLHRTKTAINPTNVRGPDPKENETQKLPPVKSHPPRVPNTSLEFDTEFRRLKGSPEELYTYIKIIPPKLYPKVLAHSLEEALPKFIIVYHQYYLRDQIDYLEGLEHLTKVPRFEMARMFLSSKEKSSLSSLLQREFEKTKVKTNPHTPEKIMEIAAKYSISL